MKKSWLVAAVLLGLGSLVASVYAWERNRSYEKATSRVTILTREANDAVTALEQARADGQHLKAIELDGEANRRLQSLIAATDWRIDRGREWRRAAIGVAVLLVGSLVSLGLARRPVGAPLGTLGA